MCGSRSKLRLCHSFFVHQHSCKSSGVPDWYLPDLDSYRRKGWLISCPERHGTFYRSLKWHSEIRLTSRDARTPECRRNCCYEERSYQASRSQLLLARACPSQLRRKPSMASLPRTFVCRSPVSTSRAAGRVERGIQTRPRGFMMVLRALSPLLVTRPCRLLHYIYTSSTSFKHA